MPFKKFAKNSLEVLEQRIAPAGILNEAGFKQAAAGANLVHAGQGLTTGNGAGSGQYLLFVESGSAMVFITDINNNSIIDPNEITGIAAGDGLSLISFVDIHGDIVTNLTAGDELSDSDRNPANNAPDIGGDGKLLLNTRIEKIELRSVRASDFAVTAASDLDGDKIVDAEYVDNRLALSNYSIFGNILAGKGFGSTSGGLIIDDTGRNLQAQKFNGINSVDLYIDSEPSIGSILTGTKAGGSYFSFGISRNTDFTGYLVNFVPPTGQNGGDIIGVKAASTTTTFNINTIESGTGGIGARGGNISGVILNGDSAGYRVIAGDGGRGPSGGAGGSISDIADLGSVTGFVLIHSGDGGVGSTGAGGAAGTVTLSTMNVAAGLNIELGNGGNGFTSGGNGASIVKGVITTPEGDVPFGQNITATQHKPGAIGGSSIVDFNGDGYGDYIYTTNDPSQIVVVLGNQEFLDVGLLGGGEKVYLHGPRNVTAVTVGDFNDDGHDDLAVASNDAGNAGGVTVFLNQYNATNTDFVGFELGRYSPLPTLNKVEAAPFTLGWARSSNSIYSIAAGDFDGDGHTDIAAIATYTDAGVQLPESQLLIVMKNDVEGGKATGRFFGEFGIKGAGNPQIPRVIIPDDGASDGTGNVIVKASVAKIGDAFDTMYVARTTGAGGAAKSIYTYQLGPGIASPARTGTFALGQVDTNRNLPQGTNNNIGLTDAFSKDFAILDFGTTPNAGIPGAPDGVADLAVLVGGPAGFVVTLLGNPALPTSGLLPAASNPNAGGQNSGIFFGAPANGNGGFDVGTSLQQIRATDLDNDGVVDEVIVLNYSGNQTFSVDGVTITGPDVNNGLGRLDSEDGFGVVTRDDSVVAFDSYRPTPNGLITTWAALVAAPTTDPLDFQYIVETPLSVIPPVIPNFFFNFTLLVENTINITAGNGGDALVGKGGTGGSIGGGLNSLSITLPQNPAFAATLAFTGGDGGDGFSTGGAGGKVSGLNVRYITGTTVLYASVSLFAGDGGFGVAGAGGAGGSLSANSIESGERFVAGNGGRGSVGGAGGSVIGNGVKNLFDTSDTSVEAHAGFGGAGVKRGGDGGSVTNFRGEFITPIGSSRGTIYYTGGDGGNAAAGPGGKGGGVINSSPIEGVNAMGGEIYLQGGNGGTGTVGGGGGSITNFKHNPSIADNPPIVTFIGGNGGAGTSGNGGAGGSITDVSTPSVGVQDAQQRFVSGFLFDRVIAGSGGASGGAAGGAGGSITRTNVSSSDGSIVFIAGAGGRGLSSGGAGGSIVSSATTIGQDSQAKVLVVAGAGGDAFAFLTNPLDNPATHPQKPYGGKVGKGGLGGSITGFTQDISVQAKVDLIAGNGGGTVNYGTITSKAFVGKGGSISNVKIAGNIGSGHAENMTDVAIVGNPALPAPNLTELGLRANVPIKSYTDLDGNGVDDVTMDAFIQDNFRFKPTDAFVPFTLTDSLGNVGAIVGAAGRIKLAETSPGIYTSQPAKEGENGNFTNVSARNLLSAVAGSVNQIAAIQSITGLKIGAGTGANFTPGVVGSDKDPTRLPFVQPPNPLAVLDPTPGSVFDYLDVNGQGNLEAQLDGRLIDGAVVARSISGFVDGRVFLR